MLDFIQGARLAARRTSVADFRVGLIRRAVGHHAEAALARTGFGTARSGWLNDRSDPSGPARFDAAPDNAAPVDIAARYSEKRPALVERH